MIFENQALFSTQEKAHTYWIKRKGLQIEFM